jgi:predicted nucleic acid-binding protein
MSRDLSAAEAIAAADVCKPLNHALFALSLNRLTWGSGSVDEAAQRRIARELATAFSQSSAMYHAAPITKPVWVQKHVLGGLSILLVRRQQGDLDEWLNVRYGGETVSIESSTRGLEHEFQFAFAVPATAELARMIESFDDPATPAQSTAAALMIERASRFAAERCYALASLSSQQEADGSIQLRDLMTAAMSIAFNILGTSLRHVTTAGTTDVVRLAVATVDGRTASIEFVEEVAARLFHVPVRRASAIWPGRDGVFAPFANGQSVARLAITDLPTRAAELLPPVKAAALIRSLPADQVALIERAAGSLA